METNLVPDTAFTRAVILYVMVAGALFIPTALSELLTLIQQKSKYDHSYKGDKYKEHIIVTGDFDSTSLFEFLREFFCLDHGLATMNTYVVIVHPDEVCFNYISLKNSMILRMIYVLLFFFKKKKKKKKIILFFFYFFFFFFF